MAEMASDLEALLAQDAIDKKKNPKRAMMNRVKAVWSNYNSPDGNSYRLQPRPSPGHPPSSTAWEIFDRKTGKFVIGRKNILKLTFQDCKEKLPN